MTTALPSPPRYPPVIDAEQPPQIGEPQSDGRAAPASPRGSVVRPRRLRRTPALRALVRETRLHPSMLVAPLFVQPGRGVRSPVASMPGVDRLSVDTAID